MLARSGAERAESGASDSITRGASEDEGPAATVEVLALSCWGN
jgi:hypothetical protein